MIRATKEDSRIVTNILAEAFKEDPISNWVSYDETYPNFIFEMLMDFYLKNGEVWLNESMDAAVMCLKPGVKNKFTPSVKVIVSFIRRFGLGAFYRVNKFSLILDKHHYKPDHYYVLALGTSKAGRGKGQGRAILRHIIDRGRDMGVPTYLENSNIDKNTSFYMKMGGDKQEKVKLSKKVAFQKFLFH